MGDGDRNNQLVKQPGGAAHDIFVAQRERVKRPRINRNSSAGR